MNLSAEQARAQLVLIGGRIASARETLRLLMQQEPRLTAYLDDLARELSVASWHVREVGENVEMLYARVWPIDFAVTLPVQVQPVRAVGHLHVSRRTGRPVAHDE